MPKAKTMNRGASLRSAVILAKLRREKAKASLPVRTFIEWFGVWVKQASKRAAARPGGLGRK